MGRSHYRLVANYQSSTAKLTDSTRSRLLPIMPTPPNQLFDPQHLTDQEQARLQNLQALREAEIEPYPARARRTHTVAQARALFEQMQANPDEYAPEESVSDEEAENTFITIAGRIKQKRVMGKISFADLEDGTGQMQVVLQRDSLPDGWYNGVWKRLVDLGDFVSATGPLMVTRAGELSVAAREVQFLSKALKPLPDKWHGVKDPEVRYRRRHLDLIGNPDVREVFRTRAKILRALRDYLDGEDFLEVETPILQPVYGGAAARPFVTHHNQLHQDLYLRISFELYLKRLIVGGFDRVYEIGRDFRNEGLSFKHNPEFTMLEFYEAYANYEEIMRRTEEMVTQVVRRITGSTVLTWQGHEIDFASPWARVSLREAILNASDIDYEQFPDADSLAQEMQRQGLNPSPDSSWGKLVDSLMAKFVEPNLIQPTFLIDYPRDISPLAKAAPDNPRFVERFEGFAGGMEICNAFSEINDPIDQLQRFLAEEYQATGSGNRRQDDEAHPVDVDYVETLAYGMPPTGGFGMGIDRLTMLLTDRDTIREVILFPHLRALQEESTEEGE